MVDLMMKTAVRTQLAASDWLDSRIEAMRSRRGDRGQTAIEYLGIVVIIAAIILALNGTSIGQRIRSGINSKISSIVGK